MCNNSDFAHLHCHTDASVQDALPKARALAKRAREMGFAACGITEHGNMNSAVEFMDGCRAPIEGLPEIKCIIGIEAYTTPDRHIKEPGKNADGTIKKGSPRHPHLTLLAQNEIGYRNLLRMTSCAGEEGFYYVPRIDRELLERYGEGVIVCSGCMGGEVSQALFYDDMEKSEETAIWFKEHFPGRYYLEMHHHGIEGQVGILRGLTTLAKKLDLPLMAANDIHYLEAKDVEIHRTLVSLREIGDPDKLIGGKAELYTTHELFMKSHDEMSESFQFIPEQYRNRIFNGTKEIADRCENYTNKVLDVAHLLPTVAVPQDNARFNAFKEKHMRYHSANEAYLAYLAFDGLDRMGLSQNAAYKDRLKHEISVINFMGVTDYFLIQREMVEFMRAKDILYGIRGSGVGSLTNYCLQVCSVDPVKWDLLFERFLNPGRGTQYKVDLPCLPLSQWRSETEGADINNAEAMARLREKMLPLKALYPEEAPAIAKELWVLENQGAAPYLCDIASRDVKSAENECQLWSALALGITDKRPDAGMTVARVAGLPDVDTDIAANRRDEVIEWAKERFGADHVSQISTRNTYQAKAAVLGSLKVSAAFQKKHGDQTHVEAQKISKLIPFRAQPPMTIDDAIAESDAFAHQALKYPAEIAVARQLMGCVSNMGVNAAGIVIASTPISSHAPLVRAGNAKKNTIATGFHKDEVERMGLVKYDYLGSTTYEQITYCLALIEGRFGKEKVPDLENLPLDDKRIFNLYAMGKTASVFQFGSPGMQKSLKNVRVDSINDLIAVNALYRPGPMDYIDDYAMGKRNPGAIVWKHPVLKKVLEVTFGIPVYQEQLIALFREMAGFTWQEVEKVRKAVSKKQGAEYEKACDSLKTRARKNGFSPNVIDEVLHLIKTFGGYAFNKSHSCSYSIESYWTAYLRVYFPSEWLAACMRAEQKSPDTKVNKVAIYKRECAAEGIKVITPNVNVSGLETTVNARGDILLPLTSMKGVGDAAQGIMDCVRPFDSLLDFCRRARANKGMVASFADGGALDCFSEAARCSSTQEIMSLYEEMVVFRTREEKEKVKIGKRGYSYNSPLIENENNAEKKIKITPKITERKISAIFSNSGDDGLL